MTKHLAIGLIASSLHVMSVAVAAPSSEFVGGFEAADLPQQLPANRTFARHVDVTLQDGVFSLEGSMCTTNREAGMDYTSNTNWHWNGTGTLRGDSLQFTYTVVSDTLHGRGSLRRDRRGGLILTLDGISYRLIRQRALPTSNQAM